MEIVIMIIIPSPIYKKMIQHCLREKPNEACGLLAGKNQQVKDIYSMTNIERSPETYFMDPREQLKVKKEIRKKGLKLAGIYHSHLNSPPYPSEKDLELAFYPDTPYLIISLRNEKNPELKAYLIEDTTIKKEVAIKVV